MTQASLHELSRLVECLCGLLIAKEGGYLERPLLGPPAPGEYTDPEEWQSMVPHFRTRKEMDAWWDSLPKVEADVDPRLREKVKTSIRLSRKVIDGFNYLAKQKGIRSGQTLMKVILGNYVARNLPEDF